MEYFITCNGIPVHVSESGTGDEAIVLLHGYLETLYVWEEFRTLFPGSSHIISFDLPGLGLTGSDPEVNSMQFDSAVLLSLMDRLKISKSVLIGHSMGGYVGQQALRDYPERITALVNLNSIPYPDDPSRIADREREISFILNGKLVQLAQIALPNMYAKENLRKCDEKLSETVEICETHDPQGVAAVVRGLMARPDNVALLRSTKVPVMFLFGDSDMYIPLSMVSQVVSDLPGCRHEIIPGSGHNAHLEAPEKVYSFITDFLSKAGC